MQTMLSVCQQLRSNAEQDVEQHRKLQSEHDALLESFDDIQKTMDADRETMKQQRNEIGESTPLNFAIHFRFLLISFRQMTSQTRHGMNAMQHCRESRMRNHK